MQARRIRGSCWCTQSHCVEVGWPGNSVAFEMMPKLRECVNYFSVNVEARQRVLGPETTHGRSDFDEEEPTQQILLKWRQPRHAGIQNSQDQRCRDCVLFV